MTIISSNFPISDFYRENIIEAETVARGGGWWTAVFLIKDPNTNKPFIGLYRWQLTESGWKVRKRFTFRRIKEVTSIVDIIQRFSKKLEN